MLATGRTVSFASPGAEFRPLRAIESVRPAATGRQERIAPDGFVSDAKRGGEVPAPGYGRPSARLAPAYFGPSAFLAQMIAQADDATAGAQRARQDEGVRAYRRMTGEDLAVIGPAGAVGLVL